MSWLEVLIWWLGLESWLEILIWLDKYYIDRHLAPSRDASESKNLTSSNVARFFCLSVSTNWKWGFKLALCWVDQLNYASIHKDCTVSVRLFAARNCWGAGCPALLHHLSSGSRQQEDDPQQPQPQRSARAGVHTGRTCGQPVSQSHTLSLVRTKIVPLSRCQSHLYSMFVRPSLVKVILLMKGVCSAVQHIESNFHAGLIVSSPGIR